MEDAASSAGGRPSRLETPSSTTASGASTSNPVASFQPSPGRETQSPTNHRRRYTGSSIPLRPDGPLPPVLSNGFAPISAPSIIGPAGFDSVDRFRTNLGYTSYSSSNSSAGQRQGRAAGLRHSSPNNHQRRQSRSSDRDAFQQEPTGYSIATWSGVNPTRIGNSSLGPRHSIANLQSNHKPDSMLPPTRPVYRSQRSNHNLPNSMPSTPRHPRPRQDATGKSRSPSPPTFTLDSPRSAASDPSIHPAVRARCQYESGLVLQRRRIPYSLGSDPLPDEQPPRDSLSTEDEAKLTADMDKLYADLLPSEESTERRQKFLAKLEKLLNDEWPGHEIKVRPFGSTENKLCSTESDVDVCIVTTYKELENVCILAKALGKHHMERIICVQNAKVPIVRIWDPEYKLQCDMNVNNTLALENTRMVKTYVDIDSRVRPLAMIIKYWTKQRILNDAAGGGTLSSYTWICMIINFLQTRDPPILPSLHQREHKKLPPQNGVDVSFDDDIEKLRGFGAANTESIGSLLFGFFKRYGYEIDFERSVVSVRMGKIISKAEKKWDALLGNRLCVEEPFSTSRNLSNGADDNAVRGIHEEFRRAFKLLSESPANVAGWSEEYQFPKEEHISSDFVKPNSGPVRMTRSNSANKGRGDSNNRPRKYGGYGAPRNAQFNSRRASSGSTYANLPGITAHLMQTAGGHQFIQNPEETFAYPSLDGIHKPLLDVQHAYRHVQLSRANFLQSIVQAQASSQQGVGTSPSQTQAQMAQTSSQLEAAAKQQQQAQNTLLAAQTQLQALHVGYPYLLYPTPILYLPQGMDQYGVNMPPVSPIPQSSLEQRLNRTKNLQPGGPRSRSQPAPDLDPAPRQIPTVLHPELSAESQDMLGGSESIATASSTSEHPSTPCESGSADDQFGDYYGYLYPGTQQPVGQPSDIFVGQKDILDHQRRLSKEKMIPPKFSDHRRPSQPPSPITTVSHAKFAQGQDSMWSSSDGDGERSISQDSFDEEPRQRGPVIVNGSASSVPVTPPFDNDNSPQLSLHGDSPHEEGLYPSSAGFADAYGASLLDPGHPHAVYGQNTTHDDLSGIPKATYAVNPYTGQPIAFPFLQLPSAYSMAPTNNLESHPGQKQRYRQPMHYGRQYDVDQVASSSKYLDLATPTHSLNNRESKSSQTKEKFGSVSGSNDANGNQKQSGNGSGSWKTPSPPKSATGKKGGNKQSGSEADNSSEDGNRGSKQSNKSGGTIRASSNAKVMEAIQSITKSASTAGQCSTSPGSKASGSNSSNKLEDSPIPPTSGHGHNHSKSKESWNKNSHKRKSNNKKKRPANAETAPPAGEERKGG